MKESIASPVVLRCIAGDVGVLLADRFDQGDSIKIVTIDRRLLRLRGNDARALPSKRIDFERLLRRSRVAIKSRSRVGSVRAVAVQIANCCHAGKRNIVIPPLAEIRADRPAARTQPGPESANTRPEHRPCLPRVLPISLRRAERHLLDNVRRVHLKCRRSAQDRRRPEERGETDGEEMLRGDGATAATGPTSTWPSKVERIEAHRGGNEEKLGRDPSERFARDPSRNSRVTRWCFDRTKVAKISLGGIEIICDREGTRGQLARVMIAVNFNNKNSD